MVDRVLHGTGWFMHWGLRGALSLCRGLGLAGGLLKESMRGKHVFCLGLLLFGDFHAGTATEGKQPTTAQVTRTRYGVDPQFTHGTPVQRGLDQILSESLWRRLEAIGLKAPTRVRPGGHNPRGQAQELRCNGPLPVWSDLTLCRVYRELRAVRYRGALVLDVGEVFPFQEQTGGWFGYAMFDTRQPRASHGVIEVRNDASQPWRIVMLVRY